MKTNCTVVHRLLDETDPSVTLSTISKAAAALGRSVQLQLAAWVVHDWCDRNRWESTARTNDIVITAVKRHVRNHRGFARHATWQGLLYALDPRADLEAALSDAKAVNRSQRRSAIER